MCYLSVKYKEGCICTGTTLWHDCAKVDEPQQILTKLTMLHQQALS